MTPSELARVLRAAADECDAIASEVVAARADWVDQRRSPLGPRRHTNAVRRRVAAGDTGAAIVGRRMLLSPDALAAELESLSRTPKAPRAPSIADELRAELLGAGLKL